MTTAEICRPPLSFKMLQAGIGGGILVTRAIKDLFGPENYALFRQAGKKQEYIPEEDRLKVDLETYDRVQSIINIRGRSGKGLWNQALELSDQTVGEARYALYADQDRRATLITNIAAGERRPSSILEGLTTPAEFMGRRYKYERGRQLGVALLCAEIIGGDEDGNARRVLDHINWVLERQFFTDKKSGDPKDFQVYSYHTPRSNRLVGMSKTYPDPRFADGLWVKSLEFPVRTIGLRNVADGRHSVPALYDAREKQTASAVIKALQRSLKATQANGGTIETTPYSTDRFGFRLVLMEGGDQLRDQVMAQAENLLRTVDDVVDIKDDDKVNPANGDPYRVRFRRRQVIINDLPRPLEVIVQTLPDYIAYQYEVGEFDPELGMHNGQAWILYKLRMVADIAPHLWPPAIFKRRDPMDPRNLVPIIEGAKKAASYEYAASLGRKQRIYPSPYLGLD